MSVCASCFCFLCFFYLWKVRNRKSHARQGSRLAVYAPTRDLALHWFLRLADESIARETVEGGVAWWETEPNFYTARRAEELCAVVVAVVVLIVVVNQQ